MKLSLDQNIERAIRLLGQWTPEAEKLHKPTFLHCVRVGLFLQEHNYPESIILSGILHDIIEDTKISKQLIIEAFGEKVFQMIKANTKDISIDNGDERINELIARCAMYGEEALIVKTADVLDNYAYYSHMNDAEGVAYCLRNKLAIIKYLPKEFKDPIFEKLKGLI